MILALKIIAIAILGSVAGMFLILMYALFKAVEEEFKEDK